MWRSGYSFLKRNMWEQSNVTVFRLGLIQILAGGNTDKMCPRFEVTQMKKLQLKLDCLNKLREHGTILETRVKGVHY